MICLSRPLLLLVASCIVAAHHGNDCDHKDDHQPEQRQLPDQSSFQEVHYYPRESQYVARLVQASPSYYIEHGPVLVPVHDMTYDRFQRQVFGGAANIPVAGGPIAVNRPQVRPPTQPLRPPTQQLRPVFGGAANIPVRGGPFPLRPARDGIVRHSSEIEAEAAVVHVPQTEDSNAGKPTAVILGPIAVNRPSWQTKPQVEASYDDIPSNDQPSVAEYAHDGQESPNKKGTLPEGDFPKTKPFPVPGSNIGQPKPVLSGFPKTKPFPVPGTNIGQPQDVVGSPLVAALSDEAKTDSAFDLEVKASSLNSPQRDFPKTKPFPVPGTNIGQPQDVVGSPLIAELSDEAKTDSTSDLDVKASSLASPQRDFPKTKPFPVPGTNIGQPRPVGGSDFPKTKPFPVPGSNIGRPQPVGSGVEPAVADLRFESTEYRAAQSDFPKTKPFAVPGTGIGQPQRVADGIDSSTAQLNPVEGDPIVSADGTSSVAFVAPEALRERPKTKPFPVAGTNIGYPQPVQSSAAEPPTLELQQTEENLPRAYPIIKDLHASASSDCNKN